MFFGAGLLISLSGAVFFRGSRENILILGRLWARICLAGLKIFCGIRIRVEGLEHLPAGQVVIAAQHQSELDIFIWLTLLERPAIVYKRELADIPLFGALLEPAGMIKVDRDGAAAALRKMLLDCRAALTLERQVVIFPEGTRVTTGARVTLQPGVAALAKIAGVPVIPAATDSGRHWGTRALQKTPGIVTVRLYPPLDPGLGRDAVLAELASIFYDRGVIDA